jgi:arylsulfatase A-like enzyme
VPRAISAAAEPPNILVIVVDQMRAPCWFAAGNSPDGFPLNLARLRRGAVSFARHYTASNDCTPARSALLTGLHTHQTGCMITGASTLDPGFATWGTALRDRGYQTYWYGKWHLTDGDGAWTPSDGPSVLDRYGFGGGTFPSPNGAPGQGQLADPLIADQFAHFYREGGRKGPWCTTVSFVNPHDIAWWYRYSEANAENASLASIVRRLPPNFETPGELEARGKPLLQRSLQQTAAQAFGPVPFSGPNSATAWLPLLDLYVKLQQTVDRQIGAVLDTLASQPQVAANTVIVFTSDHGEYAASHGMRGKGASVYEEAIRVPLIVKDPRGKLTTSPAQNRRQITSSVDIVPLLLTIASGSNEWRSEPRYADLSSRADLAAILADPTAPGREYAVHATDEVVTEFASQPYASAAPLHIVGVITTNAKYATYSHWKTGTTESLPRGQQTELYDYSTARGRLETLNLIGRSPIEDRLRTTLENATHMELRAPLAASLHNAQRRGLSNYLEAAAAEAHTSRRSRLRTLDRNAGHTTGVAA